MRSGLSRLILVLIALNLAAILWLLVSRQRAAPPPPVARADVQKFAANVAASGRMSAADAARIIDVEVRGRRDGKISDEDLGWALSLVNPSRGPTPELSCLRNQNVLIAVRAAKNYTPGQKDTLFRAVEPLFTSPEGTFEGSDRVQAVKTVALLRDKRAVPYLLDLLHHKLPSVRSAAKKALEDMGYHANG